MRHSIGFHHRHFAATIYRDIGPLEKLQFQVNGVVATLQPPSKHDRRLDLSSDREDGSDKACRSTDGRHPVFFISSRCFSSLCSFAESELIWFVPRGKAGCGEGAEARRSREIDRETTSISSTCVVMGISVSSTLKRCLRGAQLERNSFPKK